MIGILIFARSLLGKLGANQENMAQGHVFRRVLLFFLLASLSDTPHCLAKEVRVHDDQAVEKSVEFLSSVVPINWDRFVNVPGDGHRHKQIVSLLLNSTQYNLNWIERTFELDPTGEAYVLKGKGEGEVRPACSVVYGMGVALKTGFYDAKAVGITKVEAKQRTIRLLRGIVRSHTANSPGDQAWGVPSPATGSPPVYVPA